MITVSSPDAEKLAKAFRGLVSPRGLLAINRRVVNQVGSTVRKGVRELAGSTFGTTPAALQVQGKAAPPGAADPAYRLYMARNIPLARLRARYRKISRKRGRQSLTVDLPTAKPFRFRSVRREGRAFKLLRAGELPERFAGGVYTGAGRAFDSDAMPDLKRLRIEAERDLPQFVADGLNAALRRRRR